MAEAFTFNPGLPGLPALVLLVLVCPVVLEAGASNNTVVTHTETGITVAHLDLTPGLHRERRAITKDMPGFNEEEKKAMLIRHNKLRTESKSSNIMIMEWNEKLAATAQARAEKCIFEHSKNLRGLAGWRKVGENLYVGNLPFDPATVVQGWYDEIKDYDYETTRCSLMCGHYTQVVWSTSRFLGCGVKYCPVLKSVSFGKGYNVVCHYGPGGNFVHRRPFAKGKPCSKCAKGFPYCAQGLCSKRPMIGSRAEQASSSKIQMTTALVLTAVLTQASYR